MSTNPSSPGGKQTSHESELASPERARAGHWVGVIMLGLIAWGIFHAVGAYGLNQNPWRAVMVLACSGLFLGFWAVLLRTRDRKLGKST